MKKKTKNKKKSYFIKNTVNFRLSIFRSHKHIYSQLINDYEGRTLIACSTIQSCIKDQKIKLNNLKASFVVGFYLAHTFRLKNLAILQKIKTIHFNKIYHGRIKYLIEGIRVNGLII